MDRSITRPILGQRTSRVLDSRFRQPVGDDTGRLIETFLVVQHRLAHWETARVAIQKKGRVLFVNLSEVLTVVAQNNCALLQGAFGSYRLRGSISTMAEKLERYGFVRINRSVLVNGHWVEKIRPCPTGEHVLRLKGEKEFVVTRTYKKNIGSLAEVWLGSDTLGGRADAH